VVNLPNNYLGTAKIGKLTTPAHIGANEELIATVWENPNTAHLFKNQYFFDRIDDNEDAPQRIQRKMTFIITNKGQTSKPLDERVSLNFAQTLEKIEQELICWQQDDLRLDPFPRSIENNLRLIKKALEKGQVSLPPNCSSIEEINQEANKRRVKVYRFGD
jgi:hypothetical protein